MRTRIVVLSLAFIVSMFMIAQDSIAQQAGSSTAGTTMQQRGSGSQTGPDGSVDSSRTKRFKGLWDELTPDQKKQAKMLRLESARRIANIKCELGKRRVELIEFRLAEKPDFDAIDKKQTEIWNLMDEKRKERRQLKQKFRSLLTPEQREKIYSSGFSGCPMGCSNCPFANKHMRKGMGRGMMHHGMMGHGMMGQGMMNEGMMGRGMGMMRGMHPGRMGMMNDDADNDQDNMNRSSSPQQSAMIDTGYVYGYGSSDGYDDDDYDSEMDAE